MAQKRLLMARNKENDHGKGADGGGGGDGSTTDE